MNSVCVAAKPGISPSAPAPKSTRLLGQMRERIRYFHYRLQTEKTYLYWSRFFIRWRGRNGAMRHPKVMGTRPDNPPP